MAEKLFFNESQFEHDQIHFLNYDSCRVTWNTAIELAKQLRLQMITQLR